LDRALIPELRLDGATKLALLSFDATIRSNLSVGMPIDILRYQADSFTFHDYTTLDEDNAYWRELRDGYANGLRDVLADLPLPPQSWDA
jgi:putative proteasome-type protease